MGKKDVVPQTEEKVAEETPFDEPIPDGEEGGASLGDVDFNVEDEYKPEPLIPKGTYHGVTTKVSFVARKNSIDWEVCLQDNSGVMNDGETSIDGSYVTYSNWLPKPGDEDLRTKSGKQTKRQWKMNSLKEFYTSMGIDMSTPEKIAMGLAEAQWIGLDVDVDVTLDEYNGKFRNSGNNMRPRTSNS